MATTPMLIVCATAGGCTTRDGTLQPEGTAFDRVPTDEFPPPPGCALIPDDGRPLYVQNSNGAESTIDSTIEPRVAALEAMLQSIFAEQQQQS